MSHDFGHMCILTEVYIAECVTLKSFWTTDVGDVVMLLMTKSSLFCCSGSHNRIWKFVIRGQKELSFFTHLKFLCVCVRARVLSVVILLHKMRCIFFCFGHQKGLWLHNVTVCCQAVLSAPSTPLRPTSAWCIFGTGFGLPTSIIIIRPGYSLSLESPPRCRIRSWSAVVRRPWRKIGYRSLGTISFSMGTFSARLHLL